MDLDPWERSLLGLGGATRSGVDWRALHHRAVGAGCGAVMARDDERVAATDELLGATVRELVVLAELSAYASFPPLVDATRPSVARITAALIRLLDLALQAHAREVGYQPDRWREGIATTAAVVSHSLCDDPFDEYPLPATIRRATERITDALISLRRDRLGVAEALADAAGELLVIYAAADA